VALLVAALVWPRHIDLDLDATENNCGCDFAYYSGH